MNRNDSSAGGFVIAIATLGGFLIGAHEGQMSAGFLLGLAGGSVAAVALWLVARRRQR